ncbi:MAG: hypothetical protein PHC90_12800 [Syntrophorhabdaceae bacterium]|nr:hypothetical protein [Syntrophorhabdaceae bacterium]
MSHIIRTIAVFLAIFIFLSGAASAQWVFLGRKALGKVKQLTSEATSPQPSQSAGQSMDPQPGYDVATVLLEAPADKVYGTAIRILQANKDIRISKKDDKALSIEFIDGTLAVGMQVTPVSKRVSQLLVASTTSGKSGTSIVLKGIMRVCKEMGVHCQTAD